MLNQPTQSDIKTAKRQAVGGARKRCRKGKNCSAACIQAGMTCLVEMPESAGIAIGRLSEMLLSRVTAKGREYMRTKGIVRGNVGGGTPVPQLDANRKAPLSKTDLDNMERNWQRYTKTGEVGFPFKVPKKYDDSSGTPEAVNEIVSLRDSLKQDQKTGRIDVPKGVKISDKAKALVDEWNSLDLPTVYVNSVMGNRLNVSGLGVQAGPRNSVPKDAVRGLVQYVALRRQQAELEDGPNGKRITSYRDPFTGQRRPYMIGDSVVASQDHWMKPFGIYGIQSENDVKNTVYMPASMNSNKGEASPARYLFRTLVANGRLQDSYAPDRGAVGGFGARYDKDSKKDFLPKGITRDAEKLALGEKASWMVNKANEQITSKVIPKIEKTLREPTVTMTQVAAIMKDIAKYESKTNYFGGDLRFANGARIMTPYEQNLTKGIKLEGSTPALQKNIQTAMVATGKTPKQILQEILENRKGYTPKATNVAPEKATPKATSKIPAFKSLNEDQRERVERAAHMTDYRIDKRLNERQFYDDETNKKIMAANKVVVAPFQKMSSDEKAALSLYGQDGVKFYAQVNELLRNGDFEGSTPESKKLAEFISGNLRTGLEKLPPAKAERLERAVSGNFATGLGKLKVGDVIEDKGFGSYTTNGSPTLNQFIKSDQPNAVIRVRNPLTAREVAPVMEYSREGEHITLPGTRLRLAEVQEKGEWSRKLNAYVPAYVFEEVSQ